MRKRIFPYRSPDIDTTDREKHPFDELVDQVYHLPHPRQRINDALIMAARAGIAGDDPRRLWWIIDQIMRALTDGYYLEWVELSTKGAVFHQPGYWEEGVKP